MKTISKNHRRFGQTEARSEGHSLLTTCSFEPSFQVSTPIIRGGPARFSSPTPKPLTPRFWAISQGFFNAEAKREYRLEALLFALIAGLGAWPIGLAFQAAMQFIK